ncbi:hypothetical protein C5967_02025 [Cronobacter sakazakii]|nr:hypothetical protein C5967_02025 [Cronobacter sakazakii]PQX98132.1 hypothetical protein C5963_16620 [Cronobacter sakazakii]PQY38825.1 hypothetical protein C5965_17405 [Cronobacter sakazakii]PQY50802.1 hypothetical protein C5969_20020 [Cronobacter sakazakii]PUW88046.1 hypothetical protein AUM92_20575 [Cronobacter sakazakii]
MLLFFYPDSSLRRSHNRHIRKSRRVLRRQNLALHLHDCWIPCPAKASLKPVHEIIVFSESDSFTEPTNNLMSEHDVRTLVI